MFSQSSFKVYFSFYKIIVGHEKTEQHPERCTFNSKELVALESAAVVYCRVLQNSLGHHHNSVPFPAPHCLSDETVALDLKY